MKFKILGRINKPQDLKNLSQKELDILAREIREYMVDSVSKTGGHLASSLGAVEITLALYSVFNPPEDKVIWDVGHQAYAHKILTGRRAGFRKLRSKDGISGFLKPSESKYDAFGAGHTSTSISAAMGFAKARDLSNSGNEVVAVLGDASLANGMSLEAINSIGHDKTNVIIVVIDNEMSISPTVGALSSYMNNIMTGNIYNRMRDAAKFVVTKLPGIGEPTANLIKHLEEGVKGVFSPGIIFEELGVHYFGPIDGHNIKLLINTLNNVKKIKGPRMLHIITKKGKGYGPAEKNPTLFHGLGRFDRQTGIPETAKGEPSYSRVFSEELIKIAKKNKKIIAIVAAMIEGTNLSRFRELFPRRFFDVGIAEEHAVTFAAGLAKAGMRPVVAIYSTFLQRSVDQIIHDVGIQGLPVIFAMDRAGIVGEDGATHHGVFDIAFMKMVPNMTVMAPSDASELKKLLRTAAAHKDGPVSIRFPRGKSWNLKKDRRPAPVKIGKGRMVKKGSSLTIVSLGPLLPYVINAVREIESRSRHTVEIIDARFAKPMDRQMILASAEKTRKVITIEEGVIQGGFGQSVAELINGSISGKVRTKVLGVPDRFVDHGTMEEVRADCGLTEKGIIKAIKEIL